MKIYVLLCLILNTIICFSEENAESLDTLKKGIEQGQKILDEKVERYNRFLKKHHQKKQQDIQEKRKTEALIVHKGKKVKDPVKVAEAAGVKGNKNTEAAVGDKRTRDGERVAGAENDAELAKEEGSSVKVAEATGVKGNKNTEAVVGDKRTRDGERVAGAENNAELVKEEGSSVKVAEATENVDERNLRRLSDEIEKEQEILDRKVEYYNKKLQKKSDLEEEEKEYQNLTEPLREEIQRLTNIVEHLQKEVKEFKKSAREGVKAAVNPDNKTIQEAFEQALVLVKENVREGIVNLVKFIEEYPEEVLTIEANLKLGDAYNKIGRWKKAYAAFESVMHFDKAIIPQIIEAKLGKAEAQIGKNDREAACMTLIKLEKSNNPMSEAQLNRYQKMLVDYHCSSKMDRDERKKEKTKKTFSLLDDPSANKKQSRS